MFFTVANVMLPHAQNPLIFVLFICGMPLDSIDSMVFEAGGHNFRFRTLQKEDREQLIHFANRNQGIINGPFPVTTEALTKGNAHAEKWISEKIKNAKEDKGLICVIENSVSKQIIGYVSAFQFDWRIPKCEIAWLVDVQFQRRGIALTCCKYLLGFLNSESGMQKIICRIDPKNLASIELAKKLNFYKEGTHKRDFRDGYGRLLDVDYFALLT